MLWQTHTRCWYPGLHIKKCIISHDKSRSKAVSSHRSPTSSRSQFLTQSLLWAIFWKTEYPSAKKAAGQGEGGAFSLVSLSSEWGNFSRKCPIRILFRCYLPKQYFVHFYANHWTWKQGYYDQLLRQSSSGVLSLESVFLYHMGCRVGGPGGLGQNHLAYSEG